MFNEVVKLKDSGLSHTSGNDLGFFLQWEFCFYAYLHESTSLGHLLPEQVLPQISQKVQKLEEN